MFIKIPYRMAEIEMGKPARRMNPSKFIFPSIFFGHIHRRFFISAIYSNACHLCISLK